MPITKVALKNLATYRDDSPSGAFLMEEYPDSVFLLLAIHDGTTVDIYNLKTGEFDLGGNADTLVTPIESTLFAGFLEGGGAVFIRNGNLPFG